MKYANPPIPTAKCEDVGKPCLFELSQHYSMIGMPTYILFVTLTGKWKEHFKQEYTTTRDQFKKAAEQAGGSLTGYVTAGPYDAIEILDVPSDDAALSILLTSLSADAVKIMSLRAFPEDQAKNALKKLP